MCRKIGHWISAAARHFRERKVPIPVNQKLKQTFSQTMVSFFPEPVSYGPEKKVIGG